MRSVDILTLIGDLIWVIMISFLVVGWYYPSIGLLALLCMISPLITTIITGRRVWCGSVCPRGSFNDNILVHFSFSNMIPAVVRTIFFRLSFLIFLFYILGSGIIKAQGDLFKIGFIFYRIILITTIIAIILGVIFHQRTWCACCPMGSLSSFIIMIKRRLKQKGKKIKVDHNTCVKCRLCQQECTMDLNPSRFWINSNNNLDCIYCLECIKNCPVDALSRD